MTEQKQTNSEKLDEILEKVNEIEKKLVQREHYDEQVREHDEFINGNGKPGAKSQLAIIQESQKRISAINTAIIIALVIDILAKWLM